ncbi:Chromo (CHRromatin Organization MOdifier) domain [Teratosphaeria destructans]|uniref:Chromo (CHRromatin Organization MOdifier) domain n=1 Tax=Teratosphaeria destructans TaxID=418781 RepID=A0A9W7T1T0_9PEZI|nr:Chromo (CHRromatin Organization MOdifier) domain [Teratosphaeria destructans]
MAPQVVVTSKSAAPSAQDVASITQQIYTSKTSQEALDASYALTDLLLNSVGFRGLHAYDVLPEAIKAAGDKKSAGKREGAMFALGAMIEKFLPKQKLSEVVFMLQEPGLVPCMLDALADKQSAVREGAKYGLDTLFSQINAEAKVFGLLPILLTYLGKKTGKWQGTVGALELIGRMADKAKIGMESGEVEKEKEVLRFAMGKKLDRLIPVVEAGMHDLKSEVSKQAIKSMNSLTTLLQNDDVAPRIPLLVKAMEDPSTEALRKAIHALSQTTFVTVVDSPVLALLTPLLERSLSSPSTSQEVTRQTVVVVENLTKLVHDPVEARAFLPKLKPGVQRVAEGASLPEVREIGQRAMDVMLKAMGEQQNGDAKPASVAERVLPADSLALLEKEVLQCGGFLNYPGHSDVWVLAQGYIAEMLAEDANQRALERIIPNSTPYLQPLMDNGKAEAVVRRAPQLEDGEVEIVNANFSLGYGGMLLLSHTNMRLLKGHRYGLCGRNGAGKSTLMRSIATGKLDGFPPQDEVRTCFVEHNQGEDAEITILEYCLKDPELQSEGKERISAVLEEVGFTSGPEGRQSQKVGSLSGGWKMKLALARAMLMRADVFLLDEPTNHLDVANVKWLQEYLKSHTDITSLIVSHDSGFLDEVCTDIYNYENKKLVHYRGNLAELVKVKPEAKAYYTLSASQVQFKFPPPGILTGVKSNTRRILAMTDCTFTYPGASKPNLHNVSASLTLSSRVAIIGPNGAGKSTLIKVLTGEVVPQQGKVEKHPNLRIGYIKQHALEHVEMHLEKTPNQYLQWRYANGDDREVLMKQTRILTEEDKAQMEVTIDIGDGKGPRRIEALIGRQKYKKSFQYEVKWIGWLPKHNTMISRETLLERGFQKLIQEFDDHEASREGLGFRQLEPKIIAKHFEDVGLDPEIANHNEISGLSGGQKVKVVLAGAMWNNPHLLVLDEPTNFLDRDSLGGLAVAIRDYKGGVVMISHNEEFVGALCPEQWHVVDGRLTQKGHLAVSLDRFEDSRPGSSIASSAVQSSNVSSAAPSTNGTPSASAQVSEAEGDMKFKAKKKKKLTRQQLKDREVRRRLRHIEWLNSPKGTPHPPDTDDET